MISAEEFKEYNRGAAEIGDGAASAVEQRVLGWCRSHKDASVAEKREAAKLIMEGFVQAYDDKAAVFASQWYDHRAEQGGARLKQAVTMTVYEPGSVDDVARYQAKKLAKEGDAAFARACGEFARNDAFRSLNETIIANVGRDRDKGAMFARVPTGFETCTFCLMLASRGAVYHSRKTAGEWGHFHRGCDCKVVPSFEGDPDAEVVQGVKPRELYERYKQFKEIDSEESLTRGQRNVAKMKVMRGATSSDAVAFARDHVLKSSQVLFTDKQVGKKLGKHAGDWGLDPGSDKDRNKLLSIIRRIIDEADRVDFGIWRGQIGPCAFYVKGNDLVLIDGNGKFASVMKGGVNNKRYKSGTARGDGD